MPASPRVMTLGDMVYAHDAQPWDILILNEDLIPQWTSVQELLPHLVEALKNAGVLPDASP